MRRSTVLIGLTIIVAAGAASAAYLNHDTKRDRLHQDVDVHNLALCEKTLEIAYSLYSYSNKPVDETKALDYWNTWYTNQLEKDARSRAYDLGLTEFEYNALLTAARTEAEKTIIPQLNNANDPVAKVTEMIPGCVEWPPRLHQLN